MLSYKDINTELRTTSNDTWCIWEYHFTLKSWAKAPRSNSCKALGEYKGYWVRTSPNRLAVPCV